MRRKPKSMPVSSEGVVRDIRRATRKHHAAEEKIRIVLDGLRGETSIAELCRREGIAQSKLGEGINDERIKFDRTTLATLISRIEVQGNQLVISQKPTNDTIEPEVLSIPGQKPPSKRARKILLPNGTLRDNLRPERAERRTRLVKAIARGRRWLDEVVSGSVTDAGQLAKTRAMHDTSS